MSGSIGQFGQFGPQEKNLEGLLRSRPPSSRFSKESVRSPPGFPRLFFGWGTPDRVGIAVGGVSKPPPTSFVGAYHIWGPVKVGTGRTSKPQVPRDKSWSIGHFKY